MTARSPKKEHGKVIVEMRMAVHPTKAALWQQRKKIKPEMSLREIGAVIGIDSAQQVKHRLQMMVSMGAVDYIGGQYVFPQKLKDEKRRRPRKRRSEQA